VRNPDRIIFVPFINAFGGVERLLLALSRFLHVHNIDHTISCFQQTIDLAAYADWPIKIYELRTHRDFVSEGFALNNYLRSAYAKGSPPALIFDLKGAFYAGLTLTLPYHVHLTDPPSLLSSDVSKFALSLRRINFSFRNDARFSLIKMIRGEFVHRINRRGVTKAYSVIAMSNKIACELHKLYTVKARVIRPGMEMKGSSLGKPLQKVDNFRMLSVCRLEANKRLEWVLDALADLEYSIEPMSKKINWSFDVVGDGSMRETLQNLAKQRGIEKRVVFHGKISDLIVQNLLANAQLFLIPAVQGYGLPALEALASNVPVILHRESGVSEILKGTPWVEIVDNGTDDLKSAVNTMVNRHRSDVFLKNPIPILPTETDWAHEIGMLCRWL
jgi:glycosyltransferase involved in cell wall biosynthesis